MGAGASAEKVKESVQNASVDEMVAALKDCSPEDVKKLRDALKTDGPAPEFRRITQLPIKPGSMPDIEKVCQKPEFRTLCESFAGFLGVEFLAAGDEKMIASWRWVSQAAGDGAAGELGKWLMGAMGEFITGKPSAAVGVPLLHMDLKPNAAKTVYRTVTLTFKDAAALEAAVKILSTKQEGLKAIDGLADFTFVPCPDAEKTSVLSLAGYDKMSSLEAATPKIMELMKEVSEHFDAPPEASAATIRYSLPLPFCRFTRLPIKPGSMSNILEITKKPEFTKLIDSFAGLLGVKFLAAGDEMMLACWFWVSQAAGDGAAAELGKGLMGFMGEYVAGKPPPSGVGVPLLRMDLKPDVEVAVYRTVILTFKDAAALEAAVKILSTKQEGLKAIDGLADFTFVPCPDAEKTSVLSLAGYDKMSSLEAATPKIMELMKEVSEHFDAPPEASAATVEWKHSPL